MNNQIQTRSFGDWLLKIRLPKNPGRNEVIFLLHGWTGNENSMWVFGSQLPGSALVISVRAPYLSRQEDLGGYSWVEKTIDFWPTYKDFMPSVHRFVNLIGEIKEHYSFADFDQISLVGFSQGAAMAVSVTVEFPMMVKKLAVLAGFMPDGVSEKQSLPKHLEIFIGHGQLDTIVPVSKAEETKQYFEAYGNKVIYCIAPVEHRLGRECALGMKDFLKG